MTYRRYAIERVAASLVILFIAVSLAFLLFHVIGMSGVIGPSSSPDEIARYHSYQRQGFGGYLWQFVGHGSLGHAVFDARDLTNETFEQYAPVTLSLAEGAVVFAFLIGVPLGFAWSRRPRLVRPVGLPFVHLALALWTLVVGIELGYLLGYRASLLPIAGYCNFFGATYGTECGGPIQWGYHLILPSIMLGLPLAAVYTEVTRRLIRSVQYAEDKATARRSAAIAAAKLVVRNLSWLIGGALFAETIFNFHGLGQVMVVAVNQRDPAFAQAILLTATIVAVALTLVVDLVAAAFVPGWRAVER